MGLGLPHTLLGVRDLAQSGAPQPNRRGNSISNWWISRLSGRDFRDTNCGLRRYPVEETLALVTAAFGETE